MSAVKKRDWNPVTYKRDGERYCSPACGHHCLKEDYDKAVKLADALCKRLGKGWESRVWENGGWHFSVKKGKLELHRNSKRWYWADFSATSRQFHAHGETPEDAIESALKIADEAVEAITEEIHEIRS